MPTDYCFDITTAKDYYEKLLKPAYEEFKKDSLSSVKALTCAIFLWQFAEWVVDTHPAEVRAALEGGAPTFEALRKHIASLNEGYDYVGMIATGAKHCIVTNRYMTGVKDTQLLHGFATGIGTTESHLFLEMNDGRTRYIDYDLINSREKWEEFIKLHLHW